MKKIIFFFYLLSLTAWADTPYKEPAISEIHILDAHNARNVLRPRVDDSKHFNPHAYIYHVAIKNEDSRERFNILVMKGERVVELSVEDFNSDLITDVQVSSPQDNSSTSFAGRAELKAALVEAQGFQQKRDGVTLNAINSTQSFRLFRINIETLEISPVLQQSINFVMTNDTSIDPRAFNMDYRPAAAGVYVKKKINKKQSMKLSATGGSGVNIRMDTQRNLVPTLLGIVDLKFAIDL